MTMIERVARVMRDTEESAGHCDAKTSFVSYLPTARAAVKAMREPTEKVLWAEGGHPSCPMCGGYLEGWRTMIDAILQEDGRGE